jgi:hypothetical protein
MGNKHGMYVPNIIGDSHSLLFNNATSHWLGAATAFNLWKRHEKIKEIIAGIPEGERIWFMLGEIDCQTHIFNKSTLYTLEPTDFMVEQTALIYTNYIKYFFPYAAIMATPPQGTVDNIYEFTHFASREERQAISHLFNEELKRLCYLNKIKFVDIFEVGWKSLHKSGQYLWPASLFKEDKTHLRNDVATALLQEYICFN